MKELICSDHHFGHFNILKFQAHTRPFEDLHSMHKAYMGCWNEQVDDNDTVYHLGDVCFSYPEKYFARLKGRIRVVPGNHDGWARKKKYLEGDLLWSKSGHRIEILPPIFELKVNKRRVVLCHYPIWSWAGRSKGTWHLYGHCHMNIKLSGRTFHVGVDSSEGHLWTLDELEPLVEKNYEMTLKGTKAVGDHHDKR